jgi:alpha-L-rhamnosidase/Glycosyl hydrolase 2 galactose-binding domain-like
MGLSPIRVVAQLSRAGSEWVVLFLLLSTLVASVGGGELALAAPPADSTLPAVVSLDPSKFATPPMEYRPVDCWWWDGGYLTREKLRWQLEDMHAKGSGGTWLYPRFGASQPMSAEPGFWSDGWWEFMAFALADHQRLGMVQWANDWLGRLDKAHFQSQLRGERGKNPKLMGRRLVAYRQRSSGAEPISLRVPEEETILAAAAYKLEEQQEDVVDGESRVDLLESVQGHELKWDAPGPDWLVVIVASQPHDLNYLGPDVVRRWIEIYFEKYREKVGKFLGNALAAYGPDERSVLGGNILYDDAVRERVRRDKKFDPLPDLPALFIDVGPRTDKIRCAYYDAMSALLEEHLYEPIPHWLHEHGMQHVTIATWGRRNILGQTSNYGDFFRLMRHFDITGNEDSKESDGLSGGVGAFIDSKLSSSVAHLNGKPRVALCAYWGTGWGFTQEQNVARTNINYALGMNLFNTHGVLYSFMGARNEWVPPEVHFYQPYWQTWRTFSDYVSRLSYALSQGAHRADVALVYPLSTVHAHWRDGSKFGPQAEVAQNTLFALAETIYANGIDFDFVDERGLVDGRAARGKMNLAALEFPVVLLPSMTTIRLDALNRLREFVAAGGTLIAFRSLPTASVENGRGDPLVRQLWQELLGEYETGGQSTIQRQHTGGGRAMLVRSNEAGVAAAIRAAIKADVTISEPDVVHTHQQVGEQHVFFFVNKRPEKRSVALELRARGVPEIWDARTGKTRPLYRYELRDDGTRLRLDMEPSQGVLVVLRADHDLAKTSPAATRHPQIVSDNLASIDAVRADGEAFDVLGSATGRDDLVVKLSAGGRTFTGRAAAPSEPPPIALDGLWSCEYRPTMQNRWGDFRYPASDTFIGPEAPRVKYRAEPVATDKRPDWQAADFDDRDWQVVSNTVGPYWQTLGPFELAYDSAALRQKIIDGPQDAAPVEIGGKSVPWSPYRYSWKWGVERVGIQSGSDGLGPVSPDILVFDAPRGGEPAVRYLTTRVFAPREMKTFLHFGGAADRTPRKAWVNGDEVVAVEGDKAKAIGPVVLGEGWNRVALRLVQPTAKRLATFAVFYPGERTPEQPRFMPLSRWFESSKGLTYDFRSAGAKAVGWYRFLAPPGARAASLNLVAESVEAWVNGQETPVVGGVLRLPEGIAEAARVALRVKHKPGYYEGAAFTDPIAFDCGRGQIPAGDWSQFGLAFYSGGVTYIKTVSLTKEQLAHRVMLDLDDARTSAEVTVNGRSVGVRLGRPYAFDISEALKPGDNEIRVQVLNTLANYMHAQPTKWVYEGQTVSGLLGPASLRFVAQAKVHCTPEAAAR